MVKVISKFVCGILLGWALFAILNTAQFSYGGEWILCLIWSVGIVGGFKEYLAWMSGALNASLKLGILSWMSFGSGIFGFIFLTLVFVFILIFGWIYGWFLLIRELIAAI